MASLSAGLLRDSSRPCFTCAAPSGTCWCGGVPRQSRHDEGALAQIASLLTPVRAGL